MTKQYRVIGPPGTGKTTYLVRQVERAVKAYGLMAVRVVSFTKAAAKVVTGRLGVSDDHVGTLHHFGHLALQRHQTVRGIADTVAGVRAWNEFCGRPEFVLKDTGASSADEITGDMTPGTGVGDATFRAMNSIRSVHGSKCGEFMRPMEKAFWERWTQFKDKFNFVDFADMVEKTFDLKLPFPGDPMCIFVDEAQDFTRIQWQLVRFWGEKASTFVTVGDPDQVLYGWCGVEVEDFYDPPEAKEMVLSKSFRVPKAVHELAVGWIRQTPGRKDIQYEPTGEQGEISLGHPSMKETGKLSQEVFEASQDGSVAVLVTARYMLDGLLNELKACGIPFHNPYRPAEKAWNPTQSKAFDCVRALGRYSEGGQLTWLDIELICGFLDSEKCGFTHGFKAHVKSMAEGNDGDKPVFDGADGFVNGLGSWAPRHTLMGIAIGDLDWLREHCLDSKKNALVYPIAVATQGDINEVPRVLVGNIHSVKGGEADCVFLCPDLSWSAFAAWEQCGREADEIRRVFYVGMTRARRSLRIMNAATRMAVILT